MKEEFYGKMIEWIENIGNLASSEIPEFVREVATYGFYGNLFESVIWIILLSVGIEARRRLRNCMQVVQKENAELRKDKISFRSERDTDGYMIGMAVICLVCFAFVIGFCNCVENCIKAKVSPKLYVIERFLCSKK